MTQAKSYQRPVIEISQESFNRLKSQAALKGKPLSKYLAELLLVGYQQLEKKVRE